VANDDDWLKRLPAYDGDRGQRRESKPSNPYEESLADLFEQEMQPSEKRTPEPRHGLAKLRPLLPMKRGTAVALVGGSTLVVVLLALLLVKVPAKLREEARAVTRVRVEVIAKAVRAYLVDHDGLYPDNLDLLTEKDDKGGPYCDPEDLKEPWGKGFKRRSSDGRIEIYTEDPDGNMISNLNHPSNLPMTASQPLALPQYPWKRL